MIALFALSALLLVHTFGLYGLSLHLLVRLCPSKPPPPIPDDDAPLPRVTMVVAAHDEAACIEAKVRNFQALDYPTDRLDLIVGSDGSKDGTDAIVERLAATDERIRLSAAPRSGKSAVLNRCVPMARGEWLLLTDANTMLAPDALKRLARHMVSTPQLGAVSGRLVLMRPGSATPEAEAAVETEGEGLYWRYETRLKILEGKLGILLGANGGLYAVRRAFFTPLAPDTIVDDLVIPLRLAIEGHALRYAPDALAFEETAGPLSNESRRRVRIAAGNFQSLTWLWPLLSPRRGLWAYAFWSHKLLRWCAPLFLILAFLSNAALASQSHAWLTLLMLQCLFYGLALVGALLPERSEGARLPGPVRQLFALMRAAHYFVRMNVSLAQGFARFVLGRQKAAWERSARATAPKGID
ncbi:MAG: glycosyltransferase family 2 protein [Myxococcales bacterium]|jgi:cellulose synthase/poly-beta-1,6-N-acetylglucosamine synthase-like glycosyltransferase|nr:glycosyltransferase family 2 protein [Myxococcales bacterium]